MHTHSTKLSVSLLNYGSLFFLVANLLYDSAAIKDRRLEIFVKILFTTKHSVYFWSSVVCEGITYRGFKWCRDFFNFFFIYF